MVNRTKSVILMRWAGPAWGKRGVLERGAVWGLGSWWLVEGWLPGHQSPFIPGPRGTQVSVSHHLAPWVVDEARVSVTTQGCCWAPVKTEGSSTKTRKHRHNAESEMRQTQPCLTAQRNCDCRGKFVVWGNCSFLP
jgi:hypothetical protein